MLTQFFKLSLLASLLGSFVVMAAQHDRLLNRNHQGLAKRADGDVNVFRRCPRGRMSWYDIETGNAGSCGRHHTNSEFIVAINAGQMNSGLCWNTVWITYNGKTVHAQVGDTCPGCPPNGLDLTRGLFQAIAPLGAGIIYADWGFGSGGAPAPAPRPPAPRPVVRPPPAPKPAAPAPSQRYTPPAVAERPATTSTRHSTSHARASSSASTTRTPASLRASSSASAAPTASSNAGPAAGLTQPMGTLDLDAGETSNLLGLSGALVQLAVMITLKV